MQIVQLPICPKARKPVGPRILYESTVQEVLEDEGLVDGEGGAAGQFQEEAFCAAASLEGVGEKGGDTTALWIK